MISALALIALLAPTAAPQLQAFFPTSVQDVPYQQKVFAKVESAWRPSKARPPKNGKAVVRAVIAADGTLVSTTLHHLSGSKAWDEAALAAVKKAAPFPKSAAQAEVHFHFSTG